MTQSLINIDAARLMRLVEIGRMLNSSTEIDVLLQQYVGEAATLAQCDAVVIVAPDPKTQKLNCKASSTNLVSNYEEIEIPNDSTLAGMVMRDWEAHYIPDMRKEHYRQSVLHYIGTIGVSSVLSVPIFEADTVIGVLEAVNKQTGPFTREDVEILGTIATWAGLAISRNRVNEEGEKVRKELKELDRIKNEFIAVASHELQSPLAVIIGYASFLREQANGSTGRQLDRVMKAAMRLRTLMQDMLSLRYVDAGETELELSHFDFSRFVGQVIGEREELAHPKLQSIRIDVPSEELHVIGDQDMLEVVLDTLLNNAVKFTPENGQIDVSVAKQGKNAILTISDTGPGITEEDLKRIFSRFYQVEDNLRRRHEGLGLGLAIAKDLVGLHEGRIWAESNLGEGSSFYISLPLVMVSAYQLDEVTA